LSEDTQIGFALTQAGIECPRDPKFRYIPANDPVRNRNALTIHLNSRFTPWDPKRMIEAHTEQVAARLKFPKWEGLCKKCNGRRFRVHPMGPRCADCGTLVT